MNSLMTISLNLRSRVPAARHANRPTRECRERRRKPRLRLGRIFGHAAKKTGRIDMKALISGLLLAACIAGAQAQGAPPLKLGYILDMSGLYADITGIGSVEAARMAVEDIGGSVLGRKGEGVYAEHQNKADISRAPTREFFDNQGVEADLR